MIISFGEERLNDSLYLTVLYAAVFLVTWRRRLVAWGVIFVQHLRYYINTVNIGQITVNIDMFILALFRALCFSCCPLGILFSEIYNALFG